MQQLTTGTLLQGGRYIIERVLGQGGFGITYLAIQSGLDRKVAVKEFFMKNLCDRNEETSKITFGTEGSREMVRRFKEKFLKEARNIAKFNHQNIVRVIDVFEENDTAYYVMEYAEGGSIADKLNKEGCLSEADAIRYIRQVAEALDYIHQRKINHLDVKPANIMLNEDDNAILIDFGLAKQYDAETGNQTSTSPGGISDGYAPMEQYTGVTEFSPETDVYSLAATFFKLLTGKTPPSASVIYDEGVPVGELEAQSVSQTSIEAICNAMKGRKARTQSISDFNNSLPKKGTRKRTTTKKTTTTKAASKPTESKKTAKVKSEDTEYVGNTTTTTKEETEIISQSVAEAPQKKEKIKHQLEDYNQDENEEEENSNKNPLLLVAIGIIAFIIIGLLFFYSSNKTEVNEDDVDSTEYELVDGDVIDEDNTFNGEGPSGEKIYETAEVMPSFPGGQDALMKYLGANIKYPADAEEKGAQGRVIVSFVVSKTGEVFNINLVKSVEPSLDNEALRVISSMPKWIPGSENGIPVNVRYTVPIMFKLE